jgi:phosphatidylserine/phosphatidylglycerophosphate/cardiolipin synthase-like enzyme
MQAVVHFSNIRNEIIGQLKKATQEIKVAVAWLTDEDVIRVLTQRAENGIIVTVVMSESKENFRNVSKWKDFLRHNGRLHIARPKFLHHKFCIIDNRTIVNGSYNWTYFAQSNEENIMVIYLETGIDEDDRFLKQFEAKHKFFCDKASQQIIEVVELNQFRERGKVGAEMLAHLDEEEIRLRQELEEDVKKSFDEALRIGIPISTLLLERMKLDGGGVEFIKRILHDEMTSGDMKSGFKKLEEPIPHRVDLSLEYLASISKYQKLFTDKEVGFCKKLMEKYNL